MLASQIALVFRIQAFLIDLHFFAAYPGGVGVTFRIFRIWDSSTSVLSLFYPPSPLPNAPFPRSVLLHTSKERDKLVHSWFGAEKIE